jgi:hypothetical protein
MRKKAGDAKKVSGVSGRGWRASAALRGMAAQHRMHFLRARGLSRKHTKTSAFLPAEKCAVGQVTDAHAVAREPPPPRSPGSSSPTPEKYRSGLLTVEKTVIRFRPADDACL